MVLRLSFGNAARACDGGTGLREATMCGEPSACQRQRLCATCGDGAYLGLSGIKRIPTPRMIGHKRPMPTTVRHDPEPSMLRAPMEIQSVECNGQAENFNARRERRTGNEDTKRNEEPAQHVHVSAT